MATNWYALRIKPHKERGVYQRLLAGDVNVYFPVIDVKPKNPRAARQRPYFPGYMFIETDLQELGQNAFSWMPGTKGLVAFGGIPAVVPENLIHELRKRIAEIEAAGGLNLDQLQRGDRVRIVSGPLTGYDAIFDTRLPGSKRVQVLLAFLSDHPQPMKLDAADIEKIK